MSIEDQTLPQESEKPVLPWPGAFDFPMPGADRTGTAIVGGAVISGAAAVSPLFKALDELKPIEAPAPRPVPCRIFNREPAGVRKRGLKCATCGAQADEGDTIVCTK